LPNLPLFQYSNIPDVWQHRTPLIIGSQSRTTLLAGIRVSGLRDNLWPGITGLTRAVVDKGKGAILRHEGLIRDGPYSRWAGY